MALLTRHIYARARPKRVGTSVVTGPMLSGLAEAYVEAINQGAVPTIATAWQGATWVLRMAWLMKASPPQGASWVLCHL